jgi:DNA modification methylase
MKINNEIYKLIEKPSEEEYNQLKSNIIKDGCRDSLVTATIDLDEILLDGHNRKKICEESNIEYNTKSLGKMDLVSAKIWVIQNQLGRRNLPPFVRSELVLKLKSFFADKGKDNESLGGKSKGCQNSDNLKPVDTKKELAKLANVSHDTIAKVDKILKEVKDEKILNDLRSGKKSINEVHDKVNKEIRNKEIEAERKTIADNAKNIKINDRFNLVCCDMLNYNPPTKVDLIITDPPYLKEYIHCYENLAIKANEWLKDGGILIAMAGQSYLDQIIPLMSKHMDYYWMACYLTPGQPTPLRQKNVNTTWKPLLIFTKKNDKYTGKIFGDVCKSEKNEKNEHDWQQSISGMDDIINKFTIKGNIILDPFLGSGSTGLSAIKNDCIFYGCDIDKQNVAISTTRIGDYCDSTAKR